VNDRKEAVTASEASQLDDQAKDSGTVGSEP